MSSKNNKLGKRIQDLRKNLNMSQSDLDLKVGLSYAQIGRYETKSVQPPAEIINKMADALNTSVDFLLNRNVDEKANANLKEAELIRYFKDVEQLPMEDKNLILKMIGAYIRDFKAKQTYSLV